MSDKRHSRHHFDDLKGDRPSAWHHGRHHNPASAANARTPVDAAAAPVSAAPVEEGGFFSRLFSIRSAAPSEPVFAKSGLQKLPYELNSVVTRLKAGIARIESAGGRYGWINYEAVGGFARSHGKHSELGELNGHGLGGFQVMADRVVKDFGPRIQAEVGHALSPKQIASTFLHSPALQEKLVTDFYQSQLSAGLTPREIAHNWIGHGKFDTVTGMSSQRYADNVAADTSGDDRVAVSYSAHHGRSHQGHRKHGSHSAMRAEHGLKHGHSHSHDAGHHHAAKAAETHHHANARHKVAGHTIAGHKQGGGMGAHSMRHLHHGM